MRSCIPAIAALAALLAPLSTSSAQNPTEGGPRIWVSASAGTLSFPHLNYMNLPNQDDVETATQYRGAIELDAGKVGGVGIWVGTAEFPMTYVAGGIGSECRSGCDATLSATSVMATLHVGGGRGFDMLYEASAGFTHFGDVKAPEPTVGIREATTDFTGMLGIGAAYGFTDELSIFFAGDLGLVFHKDKGGEGVEADNYSSSLGLRAGVRYGIWNRPR